MEERLPKGWLATTVGEIFEFAYGKGLVKNARKESGAFPVYGSSGVVGFHDEYIVQGPKVIVGRKGAAGAVHYCSDNCWPIDTTYFINNIDIVDSKFSYYLLRSLRLNQFETSTAIPGLNRDDAYRLKIALPPLNEQKRIVAKIEELFSELDNGIAALKTAREQLKVYRQAVLKHAFEGKLTATWREENADKLETPEQLLARIQKEREARYQQQLAEWKVAVKEWEVNGKEGKKPGKPTLPKVSELAPELAAKTLGDLPCGWCWVKLSDVLQSSPQNGLYKPSSDYGSGCKIIRIDNFYDGSVVDIQKLKRLAATNEEVETYGLSIGELIVNRVNSIEYLGKSALIRDLDEPTVFESNIMRCEFVDGHISKEFVTFFLNSRLGRQELCKNAKHAVNQASINQTDVGNAFLPMCSFEEQEIVVSVAISKTDAIDHTVDEIDQQLAKAETLRQSILKKAFSGQLVPQDEGDEPASALLARIKAEKAAAQAQAKAGAGKRGRKKKGEVE